MLILQNDIGNNYSDTTIITPLTSKSKKKLPTHVKIEKDDKNNLKSNSVALLEQILTIDKIRLEQKIGSLNENDLKKIDKGLKKTFDIEGSFVVKNGENK